MIIEKENNKNNVFVVLIFENESEYINYIKLIEDNIKLLKRINGSKGASETKLISILNKPKIINEKIKIIIPQDFCYDFAIIIFNSMVLVNNLKKINKIQNEYIKILKEEDMDELNDIININK